ncbi:hypothetical protein [Sphingomonas faeni]|uniref:hypothetical protein n=1 Tax=Sphingomonas faeni TaxID=185950 RepID=UPI002413CCA9|nr:hypothetical protein [Sphingomonas faeni]
MLRSLADRNGVKAVSKAGLILAISGHERAASWSTIGSVVAGVAASGDGEMFVLALDVDDGDTSRLITVAETERIWPELTTMLSVGLPAIGPFEHWGAALADKPCVVTLYERPAPAATS